MGWSHPAIAHLKAMEIKDKDLEREHAWTVSIGPLAGCLGILPCAFFARRMGPRKTMILQTPFNLLFWYIMARYENPEGYNGARFCLAFLSATYYYCGEEMLTQTIHRKYLKIMYAFFRSSLFAGILAMNILGPVLKKHWLCLFCGVIIIANCMSLFYIKESPVYLMYNEPVKAKKVLLWYRGNHPIRAELDVLVQYVNFIKYQSSGFVPMIKTKVMKKAITICTILFLLKSVCGYYSFVIDSSPWFRKELCCIDPYIDNIIFSLVAVIVRFITQLVHLYGPFGVRKPLLVSTFSMSVILTILGYYKFILQNILNEKENCVSLPTLCFLCLAYECGLSICPEIVMYDYMPFQVYDLLKRILHTFMWATIFVVARIYFVTVSKFNFYITLWILALCMFCGYIFIMFAVVESTGKSLTKIQIELGGNPVGTRGSRRQRIASPMDKKDTNAELRDLITKNYFYQEEDLEQDAE